MFKHRNEKCFRDTGHIKLPVNAQLNLWSFLLNYHMHHYGRAEEKSPFSTRILGGEIVIKRKTAQGPV
jgi:hypothetical protein